MIKKSPTKKTAKKKAIKSAAKKAKPVEPAITILQTAKCQTVSGKSTLSYQVGTDDKDHVLLRILSNAGGGQF